MVISLWRRWLERFKRRNRDKSRQKATEHLKKKRHWPQFDELEVRELLSLDIVPTFASNITSDSSASTIEATINTAIQNIESNFSSNVTVDITFQEMSSGLGMSSWSYYTIPYQTYYNALVSHETSSADVEAVNSLPDQTDNPVNGNADVDIQVANAIALGIVSGTASGTISLNTSICNLSRASINPTKYDLQGTTEHEIDEVLGIGSALSGLSNGEAAPTGAVWTEDLFRYSSAGVRSFNTTASSAAYFSINGGTTDLAQYNQEQGGDFNDWYSYTGTADGVAQVQDAYATPGTTPELGAELTVLDVLGYAPATTSAGTWTELTNAPSDSVGTMLLLPNGDVMAQNSGTNGISSAWYQLAPSATGSYDNGTWSNLASMGTTRLYFGSAVLPTGNVMVYGGEYTNASSPTTETEANSGQIYDPTTNTWSNVAAIPSSAGDTADEFGDDPLEVISTSGNDVLAGYLEGPATFLYDSSTNTWSAAGTKQSSDPTSEETWVKLPNGDILTYNLQVFSSSASGGQYYNPSTNTWTATGSTPSDSLTNSIEHELGPGMLLPNGDVFYAGANDSFTALYDPSTNTWAEGPVIPNGMIADDAPGAILPDGNFVFAADSSTPMAQYAAPAGLFEYNYSSNTITRLATPTALTDELANVPSYDMRMLVLPNGQLLLADGYNTLWTYSESTAASSAWQPTITGIANNGSNFTLTGTQLNGMSEGASYGDDAQMAENYPIISFTNGSGTVAYSTTSNWSSVGVQTGATSVTTDFTAPGTAGPYLLSVSASGISSSDVLFIDLGTGANNVTIQLDSSNTSDLQVMENGSTLLGEFPLSSFTAIDVNGAGSFTVNNGNGTITKTINENYQKLTVSAPGSVTAGTPFTVTVTDTNGAGGDVVGATISITGSLGTLGGVTLETTNSSGVATFDLTLTTAGTCSLTATSSTVSATSSNITVGAATATKLLFTADPSSSITAGTNNLGAVTVELLDTYNNVATSSGTTTITLSLNKNAFYTLGAGSTTGTISNGLSEVTFSGLDITTAATSYSLTASGTGLTSLASSAFTIVAAGPAELGFSTEPGSSITAATDNLSAVTAELFDTWGNVAKATSTTTVTLALNQSQFHTIGSASTTATINSGNSTASIPTLDVTTANSGYTLTASSSGLLSATSSSFTIVAAAPAKLAFSVEPSSSIVAATANLGTVAVQLQDTFGNVAKATSNTTITLTLNQHKFYTANSTTTTGMIGNGSTFTTFSTLDVTTAASSYSITATSGALTSTVSSAFMITPNAPALLTFNTEPASSVTAAVGDLSTVSVELLDMFDNVATSAGTTTVTLSLNQNQFHTLGSMMATTTIDNGFSSATFASLDVTTAASGYSLLATSSGLTSSTSNTFTVTPAASAISFLVEPNSTNIAAVGDLDNVEVELVDSFDNVAKATSTTTVTLTLSQGNFHSLGGTTATTTIDVGSSSMTFSNLDVTTVGTGYSLTATASGLTSATSSPFAITAAAAAAFTFSTPPAGSITAAVGDLDGVTAELLDSFGNVATSSGSTSVTLTLNQGSYYSLGGTTTSASIANDWSTASFSNLDVTAAGSGYKLTASAPGLASAISSAFTIVAANPAQLAFATEPAGSIGAGVGNLTTVSVELQDSFGNVATATADTTVTVTLNQNQFYTLGTTTAVTTIMNDSSSATFSSLDVATLGSGYSLTATSGGLITAISNTFAVVAGAPYQVEFSSEPASSFTAAVGDLDSVTVQLFDMFGNVTDATSNTTITLSLNQNTFHTLGGTTATATIASGNSSATFSSLDVTTVGTSYSLTATGTGLVSAASSAFAVTVAAPAQLGFSVEPAANVTAGVGNLSTVAVEIQDAFGNADTEAGPITVTLTLNQNQFYTLGTTTATATIGAGDSFATISDLDVTAAAAGYSLSASTTGLTSSVSSTFTVKAAAPAQLTISAEPAGSIVAANDNLSSVAVELLDTFGNVATATSTTAVTLTLNQGTFHTIGSNTATLTILSGNSFGTLSNLDVTAVNTGYQIGATSTGLLAATSTSFAITAAAPAQLTFSVEPAGTITAALGDLDAVTVELLDTFGNIATAASNTNVTLTLNQGSFHTLGGNTATATILANSSTTTFSNLDVTSVAGGYSLTASKSGLTTATSTSFAVTAAAASQLAFMTQPASSITAAVGDLDSVAAELLDQFGNVATSSGATNVTLAINQGKFATFNSTTATATIGNGDSSTTFGTLDVTAATTGYSLSATASGLTASTSNTFMVIAAAPAQLSFSTEPAASITAAVGDLDTVAVQLLDQFGNVAKSVGGTTVTIALNQGTFYTRGSNSATATVANGATSATFSNLDVTTVGTGYSLTATASGLTSTISTAFAVQVSTANQLKFLTEPAGGTAAVGDLSTVAVELLDPFGNVATAGSPVTVSLTLNQGTFHTLGGTTVQATIGFGSSSATFGTLDVTTVGAGYSLSATATGMTSTISSAFAITAAAPAKLGFSTQPASNVAAALGDLDTVTVELFDTFGNVATATSNVNVSLSLNQGQFHTLGGTTATALISADDSTTTFANLDVTTAGSGYQLSASASGLTFSLSNSFAVVGGTATQLVFSTEPASAIIAAVDDLSNVTVELFDAFGNVTTASSATNVTVGINQGQFHTLGGTSATAIIAANASTASISDLDVTATGSGYQLSASSSGLSGAISTTFTITTEATSLAFSTEPAANITAAVGDLGSVVVQLRDAFGNVATAVSNTNVTLTLNQGQFHTLGSTTASVTIPAGSSSANVPGLDVTTAESGYQLQATSTGFSSATSTAFTIAASTPTQLNFATSPASSIAAATDNLANVVIQLRDMFGNVAMATGSQNVTVTINQGLFHTLDSASAVANFAPGASSATISDLDLATIGSGYYLTAFASGLTTATSSTFSVTAGAPSQLSFVVEPASFLGAGIGNLSNVEVGLLDSFGNVATATTSTTVTLSLNEGSFHTLGGSTVSATIPAGFSTTGFGELDVTTHGSGYLLTATATGLPAVASNFFSVTSGAPVQIVFTSEPASSIVAGIDNLNAVGVELLDVFGNATPASENLPLTVTLNKGQFHTVGSGTATETVASGASSITFANLDVTTAGAGYQVTVSGPGLSSVTSSPFAITGRSATQVVFATQPASTTAGVDNLSAVTVQLLDPFGNYATAANSVTVVLSLNKGSFYSLGSQSVIGSIAAGSTTLNIPNLDVTAAGTGYTLTVSGSGMTGATSNAFNITAAAASQLAFATEPAGSITAALGNLGAVSVELLDPFGNVATATNSSVPVSLALSSGTFHTLGSATASGTIAAGHSSTTFANLDDTTAASGLSLTAASSGLAQAQSTSLTITPGAASVLTVTPVGTTTIAAGTPFSVQVAVQDGFGNVATGYTGRIAFSSTDPKASLPLAYTFNAGDDGVHTFANAVTFKTVGSQALTAADTNQPSLSGSSSDVSVTLASTLQLVLSVAPATAGTASNVTVTAEDIYGNVDTAFTGTVSFQSSAGAELPSPYTFTTGVGGDDGVHTFPVTFTAGGSQSITASDNADGLSQSATTTVAASLAFTTSGLPAWTVDKTGYAQALSASGGTGTLSYSISSGALPTGLSLGAGGAISGTPTATGAFSVTFQVTDALGATAQRTYSLTINPAPSISPASLETWTAGFAGYSESIGGSGGTGSLSYSITTGSLPVGLSLNAGSGAISGTPSVSGVASFTVKATDALGVSATQSFSITIDPAIVISTSTLSNWTVNTSGYAQTVQASKGTGTLTYGLASGSLPSGLSLDSANGAITGTPNDTNSGAPYQFTIEVTDSVGASAEKAYTVTINPALAISTATLENWQANKSGYSQTIQTTGGTGAVRFSVSAGSLPGGLALNASTGAVTGTPSAGNYSFTIAATDAVGAVATEPFTVVIYAPVTIATTSLPAWTVSLAGYSQVVSASGGVPALSYAISSGALPAGLSLDPNAGIISGTPTSAGTFSFSITVTDSIGTSASEPYSITVNSAVTVTTTTLANWTENQAGYSQAVRASGGSGSLSYSVSAGSLPTGLSLNATSGVISGTPTDDNGGSPFTFTVAATDSLGASGSQAFSVSIASAPTITTTALANWTIDQGSYNQTLSAIGGTGAIHYKVSAGALPAGLALNATTGVISGTPTSINNGNPYVFSITAVDADGASSLPQAFSVTINRAVALTLSGAATAWTVNAAGYSETFVATGGTRAITFSVASGSLPAGLTLDPNAGTLSGTPTAVGTFQFTIDATDSVGATAPLATSLKINAAPTMNVTTLKNWTQNEAGYSQVVSATGGTGTLTYALASGALPTGLSLSSTGVISGTPTDANGGAPFQFAVAATDMLGAGSVAESFSVTIAPAIAFGTMSLPPWTVGRAGYSQGVAASGGTGTLHYSIASGSLPAGLTLNGTTGTISGTPSVAATAQFTLAATDANGAVGKQALSITVNPAPAITTSSLAGWTAGQGNYSQALTATGGTGSISFSVTAGTLPAGLSLNGSTGVISGTPSTATGSPFSFTITAKDSTGATGARSFSITIHAALSITTANLANWTANRPSYSQVIATTGGTPAISFAVSAGSLPTGLSLSTTSGAITGMPTASGPYSFTIAATDAAGASYAKNYSITIAAAPVIGTTALPAWTLDKAYSQKINASGGTGALTFSVSSGTLPTGLSLNSTTGVVSGTPSNTNSGRPFTFTISAKDTTGASTSQAYSVTIDAAVAITTPSVTSWTANQGGYSQALSTTGGTGSLAFSVSGSLPAGLSLNAVTGVISGTPNVTITKATTYSFAVTATDTVGATGTHAYSLVINPAVSLNAASLASWTQNEAGYKQVLSATGGTGTLSYSVPANTLPAGLSLSASGTISGTPTEAGTFTFTVTATDAAGATAQHGYTIVINPAIAIGTATLPSWTADYAYSQNVTATGGTGALTYRVSSGSLPTGLSLNASTGAITGTPTNTNSNNPFQFTIAVSDATGASAQQSYSVVIHAPLAITTTTLPGSIVNTAGYSQLIATSGGTGSVTYKIGSGSVPPGLTLNTATGQLTGTPSAEGTYSFVVTVTDAIGASTQRTYSMTIS